MPELARQAGMRLLISVLLLVLPPLAGAANEHEHGHEDDHHGHEFAQHGRHEHGHALANISYAGNILKVDLTLPAIDLFGFEHQARNAHERQIRQKAVNILKTPENIIIFQPHCKLDIHQVTSTAESQSSKHSDVNASYVFDCPANKSIELRLVLFEAFNSLREVEVQYISKHRQSVFKAMPDDNRFVID